MRRFLKVNWKKDQEVKNVTNNTKSNIKYMLASFKIMFECS